MHSKDIQNGGLHNKRGVKNRQYPYYVDPRTGEPYMIPYMAHNPVKALYGGLPGMPAAVQELNLI